VGGGSLEIVHLMSYSELKNTFSLTYFLNSFVNRTFKSWNQIPAGLLASFPCKLNTFRKRVKNVVTGKGIGMGVECK
jgi:hypothetical protein